ncbi:hypothetical protein GPECTOR_77g2 [Gonium pectorale]|uniref:Ankyrin repeat domain-containing protein n=1 Tax=Gonium pectorale TaxID=33097 RepID=A0A150G226_GONPE|nr:hypothetical protein GPECTOR_77g2 [Gonium pectorale]|eukprot:KXZ43922.1 hypothetical protein GPECTOR_77g2 [Gonium pectorale]
MAEPLEPLPYIWLPGLVERYASFLSPKTIICVLRLVDKATAEQFRGRPELAAVILAQPAPPVAFAARLAAPGAVRGLTLAQRKHLLRLTATHGVVANMEAALVAAGLVPDSQLHSDLNRNACTGGHSSLAWRLLKSRLSDETSAFRGSLEDAAAAGLQDVWKTVLSNHPSQPMHIMAYATSAALRGGHLELAELLLQRALANGPLGDGCWARLLRAAASGCDLPTLTSLHQRCDDVPLNEVHIDEITAGALSSAACSATPDWQAKVEWAESRLPPGFVKRPGVCTVAAACPDAEVRLAWLLGRGYPADEAAVDAVLHAGNAAALELLLARGLRPEKPAAVTAAASNGWLEALKKLRQHDVPIPAADVMRAAAVGGRLPVLEWAVQELGASLQDLWLIHYAAEQCDREMLDWLRQHGCPLAARQVARGAAQRGDMPTLQWAVEELRASPQDFGLMNAAARSGRLEVLAWLWERGCPWGATTLKNAVDTGCEAALEWLVERGCPMPSDGGPYTAAARNGDLAMLRCLARLSCSWGPASGPGAVFTSAMSMTSKGSEPLPVLRLLVDLGCPVDWEAITLYLPSNKAAAAWLKAEAARRRQ